MEQAAIETKGLAVYYGRQRGVADVSLQVQPGEVFGFLGPNGAGKTTTLRVLLDVIRPTRGTAAIFGLDCQHDGVRVRQRIGYLPGELRLPDQLTGEQFFTALAAMRGLHDLTYQRELCQRLDLNPTRRLREYSLGNKQKVGLVAALMHKPDLLILDEPTLGLDPLAQQTVLELVRETRAEGRTVFFSSHILSEVQAVCDRVGIIREGRLIAVERIETLVAQQFRRLRLTLSRQPGEKAFALDGVSELNRFDGQITLEIRQNLQAVLEIAVQHGVLDIEEQPVTLGTIFMAYYGGEAEDSPGGSHA